MPQKRSVNNKKSKNRNKVRTITTESGNDINKDVFFPAGMQPFEVAEYLETDLVVGLNRKEIKRRGRKSGANIIQNQFRLSFKQSLINQFKGLLAPLFIISTLIMYAFERNFSFLAAAGVIVLITFINAFFASRASRALNVPRKYSAIKACVTREGVTDTADSRKLVPGDIILLKEGMVVPCDARLIDDDVLTVFETPVSGNRSSVIKNSRCIAENDSELVYPNMVYAGSIVTGGQATAIACYTGKNTLIRRLTSENPDYLPPMLKYIQKTCKYFSVISVICCFILLFLGVICGRDVAQIFLISLSVGTISLCDSMASLTAASLGYGAKKMSAYGTVVKNFNCIPSLCKINTVMCGKNIAFPPKKMSVNSIYIDSNLVPSDNKLSDRSKELLVLSLACSDLKVTKIGRKKHQISEYKGELYDEAVADYLTERCYDISVELDEFFKIDTEYSLSGEVSRVLVLYKGRNTVILKGAPEVILSRCAGYDLNGTGYKLSNITRKRILSAIEDCSQESGYIIAIAAGETAADNLRDITAERKLMFKGFISLYSDLDVNNASAVYKCAQAGIEAVVTSSDSYYTAYNMAKNAGIVENEKQVITAQEMYATDIGLFIANCPDYKLFLNFSERERVQILKYRKDDKRIVGATAERLEELALMNEADVSFVPQNAPDMLKQSSDVLLLSNGFDTLTDCLQNARLIFVRIHSVAEYLTVGAATLFLSAFIAILFGLEIPLRIQEILFGGIIFNLLFTVSLAFLPTNRKLLFEKLPVYKARPALKEFLDPLIYSFGASVCIFAIYGITKSFSATLVGYTALLFFYALTNISRTSIFKKNSVINPSLIFSAILAVGTMAVLFMFEPIRNIFDYTAITPGKLGISLALSGGYFIIMQLVKLFLEIKKEEKKFTEKNE